RTGAWSTTWTDTSRRADRACTETGPAVPPRAARTPEPRGCPTSSRRRSLAWALARTPPPSVHGLPCRHATAAHMASDNTERPTVVGVVPDQDAGTTSLAPGQRVDNT